MTSRHDARGIADPDLLLALSRRQGRRFSMHFVLLGVAGLVAALLMAVLATAVGISAGLVVVLACIAPMAIFVNGHRNLAGQFRRFIGPFWCAYLLGILLSVLGATALKGQHWLVWAGGVVALLAGLVAGHFVDRASIAATRPTGDTAVH